MNGGKEKSEKADTDNEIANGLLDLINSTIGNMTIWKRGCETGTKLHEKFCRKVLYVQHKY